MDLGSTGSFFLACQTFDAGRIVVEVVIGENDRLDVVLKQFQRKVIRAGVLKDLRKKRYYEKPSEARQRARGLGAAVGANVSKQDAIELEGTVTEVLPNATFRVAVNDTHTVLTTLGGNMRRFRIHVLAGDRVRIEVSPYDLTRGRIIFRHKN